MNTSLTNTIKTGTTEHAKVQGGFNRDFMVQSERGAYRAKLAFSCFVMPQVGDTVLVNLDNKHNHIIAIIERPDEQDVTMSFPADAKFETKHGNLALTSHNQINLTSVQNTSVVSEQVSLTANSTNIQSDKLSASGSELKSNWNSIQTISKLVSTAADKLIKTVKNSFSNIEGVEQKTSKNFVQNVKSTSSIRSQQAIITAEKDIKIDGERIHMG